jgi:hypothetical protein
MENNLFFYASSELSQDAFICYLLSFAVPAHSNKDAALTNCAKELIRWMLPDRQEPDFVVTEIRRQYKNIDILAVVNENIYIVIEDKTFTGQHDNQINRYAQTVRDDFHTEPVCVYYKIAEQPYPEPKAVNITRTDLLSIFHKYDSDNQIYKEYVAYLEYIDDHVNAYKIEPISAWDDHAYRGFFTHLMTEVIEKNGRNSWRHVSNPNGGFWGLWWNWLSPNNLEKANLRQEWLDYLYLQIENNTIAVKIYAESVQDKRITQNIRRRLYEYLRQELGEFAKGTFRPGTSMSIGRIEYSEKDYLKKIRLMEGIIQKIVDGNFVYHE